MGTDARVVFTAFSNRADAIQLANEAGERLAERGVTWALHLLDAAPAPRLREDTLVVSLGGDGTFLRSARLAHRYGARVLAVNLGRLGFLLNVPSSDVLHDIDHALGPTHEVERLALQITMPDGTAEFALNEVVVERARQGHMVRVKSFVDDDEYLTYAADAVMVSTPTGSTGYNFSAGGPVVDTALPVMILTPVAPHFTIDRSIVVGGDRSIRLVADGKPAVVLADGQVIGRLDADQWVLVRQSPDPVRVVATRSFEVGFRLRESLREGHA